jgi:hypothetical protein
MGPLVEQPELLLGESEINVQHEQVSASTELCDGVEGTFTVEGVKSCFTHL